MNDQAKAGPLQIALLSMIMMSVTALGLLWLANNVPWGFVGWLL